MLESNVKSNVKECVAWWLAGDPRLLSYFMSPGNLQCKHVLELKHEKHPQCDAAQENKSRRTGQRADRGFLNRFHLVYLKAIEHFSPK